jgi:acetolactate synthase-1/2/3 large subunit
MPTCAEVFARTLADLGIRRMFGLPGGEILDFLDAARLAGIDFVLTHDEGAASFMADATGQMERLPGVCVSTLGPGAVNMMLGVANAFLDRSPVLAVTADLPSSVAPYATHQNIDLNRLYAPITKATIRLDGENTAAKVREACRVALEPRMGPVHIALPSDVARLSDRQSIDPATIDVMPPRPCPPKAADLGRFASALRDARRPVVILGLDLAPYAETALVRRFVERMGVPTFVAPKAKGALAEDHPLFFGVCAGVAADHVVLELFEKADLLVGVGYDPIESNRLWHQTMRLANLGPLSIACDRFAPAVEVVGDVGQSLAALIGMDFGPFEWPGDDLAAYHSAFDAALHRDEPNRPDARLSPYALTRRLRELLPRDTIATTDVGAVKFIVSQAWTTFEGGALLQSNGLSSMSFGLPAAMAARLRYPDRPVLCTVGDGGLGMSLMEIETCVRRRLNFLTVVYNDSQLSLIDVIQANKGLPNHAVQYGRIDFAAAARALGAVGRQVGSLEELDEAVREGLRVDRPVVIDVPVDASEYRLQTKPWPRG